MKTACIITCRNDRRSLVQCLRSCIEQTVRFAAIIVVDESRDDDTSKVICSLFNPLIHYLKVSTRDLCASRNTGALYALKVVTDVEALLFLDAEDWLDSNFCEAHVQLLTTDSGLGFVYGGQRQYIESRNRVENARIVRPCSLQNFRRMNGEINSASLVRTSAFLDAGMWPIVEKNHHDWILFMRILNVGWRSGFTDQTFLNHRVEEGTAVCTGTKFWNHPESIAYGLKLSVFILFDGELEDRRPLIRDFTIGWDPRLLQIFGVVTSGDKRKLRQLRDRIDRRLGSFRLVQVNLAAPDLLAQSFAADSDFVLISKSNIIENERVSDICNEALPLYRKHAHEGPFIMVHGIFSSTRYKYPSTDWLCM